MLLVRKESDKMSDILIKNNGKTVNINYIEATNRICDLIIDYSTSTYMNSAQMRCSYPEIARFEMRL